MDLYEEMPWRNCQNLRKMSLKVNSFKTGLLRSLYVLIECSSCTGLSLVWKLWKSSARNRYKKRVKNQEFWHFWPIFSLTLNNVMSFCPIVLNSTVLGSKHFFLSDKYFKVCYTSFFTVFWPLRFSFLNSHFKELLWRYDFLTRSHCSTRQVTSPL